MPDLGTAYVQVVPSARGIKGSLQQVLGGEADAAGIAAGGRISGKIKGALAAAGIGAALGAGITKSIKEGANLEQAIGGIETLFKSSSDKMIKNADNAFRTAGISANKYMEQATSFAASLLQSTGGDTEKAAKAADQAILDMSDNANKMGSNIQDIQNAYQGFAKQNYTMLDNLKLGYGGTKTEMQRLLADAEKLSGQKYDISNLSDVYEAIHVVQKEMGITGTTAKEAASTLSGSFASMKAAASNFLGDLALGRNVGPAMKGLVESASTFLFDNLLPAIGRIFKSLPTAIATFVKTGIPQLLSAGAKMVESLVAGMKKAAPNIASNLPKMVSQAFDKITSNLPAVLEKGRQLVASLVKGIVSSLPSLISAAADIAAKIPDFLAKNVPVVAAKAGQLLAQLVVTIVKNVPKILAAAEKLGLALLKGLINKGPTMLKAGATLILNFAKGIRTAALSAIKSAAEKVVNALLTPIKSAKTAISNVISKIKSLFSFSGLKEKVKRIWEGIKSKITAPIESAKRIVKGIIDKIKGFFPVNIGKLLTFTLPNIGVKRYGKGNKGVMGYVKSWVKHATGGIFTRPTLLGSKAGNLHQVGEAGAEAILPLKSLWNQMDRMSEKMGGNKVVNNYWYITVDGSRDPMETAREISRAIRQEVRMA